METPPALVRTLGAADLTWLYLAAVVNLNIVPAIAAEGYRTLWFWGVIVLCFFLPQGLAVIVLARKIPGEGGLYLWTKQTFGDFHGFLCGWCYWLTNMFFVPSLLLYVSGTLFYIGGATGARLAESPVLFLLVTLALLWFTVAVSVRGLGAEKWINNAGGAGSLIIGGFLIAAASLLVGSGHRAPAASAAIGLSDVPWQTLGLMCLAMVGLEIGPVMGDEIRDAKWTVPKGVLLGGLLCATVYVGSTAALLFAIPNSQMTVVQGMMQALDRMTALLGIHWTLTPLAILMAVSIAGSTAAWVNGSARILFVSGLDRYLPKALGNIHPRYASPYIALLLFGGLASVILGLSFVGASVKEAYVTLLDLSVALQMVSYTYLFLTLLRTAASGKRVGLLIASLSGLMATVFAFVMAFVPSHQVDSIWSFEIKMVLAVATFLGVAWMLFSFYSRRAPGVRSADLYPEVTK